MTTPISEPLLGRSQVVPSGLSVAAGAVALVFGIMVLAWPSATLFVIAVLFGLQLVVFGLFRIVVGIFSGRYEGWMRAVFIVTGLLVLLAGIACLQVPGLSIEIIIALVAIGWMVDGIMTIAVGANASTSRWVPIVLGVISILAAIVLLAWPITSASLLVAFGGWLLVIVGIVTIVSGVIAAKSGSADNPGSFSIRRR